MFNREEIKDRLWGRKDPTPWDEKLKPNPATGKSRMLIISKATSPEDALTNKIVVNPGDIQDAYVICNDLYVFSTLPRANQPQGFIGAGVVQREWASWALNQQVKICAYDPLSQGSAVYLSAMDLELGFLSKNRTTEQQFDPEYLCKAFIESFQHQVFAPGQKLVFDFQSYNLKAMVLNVQLTDMNFDSKVSQVSQSPCTRGVLHMMTEVNFLKAQGSEIRLKSSAKRPRANAILRPDFKFEDMGIGGLDEEFSAIFRRAFVSRIFPAGLIEKLGIPNVKGILLYGPPGTGKTLIARQIGKMLNSREPKVINGPEVLNKYVGQSEENVRKLFSDAEKEYKERGEESGLHIIIFDELDAICKQRGSRGDSTGIGDQVVNQLLAKMDGVDQLNNVLVIGMTNRKDLIDEALLRPGRLEVHVEISLPDENGRLQIIKIHTAKMSANNIMGSDVDLIELAKLTKNFSGAEISGLVKSASSFAFTRHVKVGTVAGISEDIEDLKVYREDFLNALDEVHPAFGVSEEELSSLSQNGIINFGSHIQNILDEGRLFVEQVKNSDRTPLLSVLLHGPPGSGKSALAAQIGLASDFPFIKLISAESMIGMSEQQKVSFISRVFEDSYKSPLSVLLIDKIERIIDFVAVGPRFSNSVLQALMVLLRKRPLKARRLLVLATTSEREMLIQMDMMDCFDAHISVPNVKNLMELHNILIQVSLFAEQEISHVLQLIREQIGTDEISVGVARILTITETSRQDENTNSRFVELMVNAILANH